MSNRPFSVGEKVTIRATSEVVYTVRGEWVESFAVGGAQQVCKISDDIRVLTMRAAHLQRVTNPETGTP